MISLVDAHCDTLTEIFLKKEELIKNSGHISIEKLLKFDTPVQFFAIWLKKEYYDRAFSNTLKIIDFFYEQVYKYNDLINSAFNYDDIVSNKESRRISAILAIEGGEALEGKISNVEIFYELGVRSITLTWNYKNHLGDGVGVLDGHGLTDFGKEVVRKMNQFGMIVDVSHLNEKGFWDVYDISKKPFIASHSNAKSICDNKRNLNDEQIKAIAEKNGVIGINLYKDFVKEKGNANIDNVLFHIDHIVNLVGENHIGFGCDFDGIDKGVDGIDNVTDIMKIYDLLNLSYGKKIAIKIMSGNFLRVIKDVL